MTVNVLLICDHNCRIADLLDGIKFLYHPLPLVRGVTQSNRDRVPVNSSEPRKYLQQLA